MNEQEEHEEQAERPSEAEGDDQSAQPCPAYMQPNV
jgi:hypothetical protein